MNVLSVICVILFALFTSNSPGAEVVTLKDVAKEILDSSNIKKASEYDLKGAREEAEKASRHWLPNLYIDNSTYETNDPTKILMGNLYQRSVDQNDFMPGTMNSAASNFYSKSSIGISVPIFQGGAGIAKSSMAKHLEISKQYDAKQNELAEYSNIANIYISIVSLQKQKNKLAHIKTRVDSILKKYLIGRKENPIGHSGLLILQTLQNKVNALIIDNDNKTKLLFSILKEIGFISKDIWEIEEITIKDYIIKYLNYNSKVNDSFYINSLRAQVDANKYKEDIKKAEYLPKINAFAEGYSFTGMRSTQPGYTVGLNMKWNLFHPDTFGDASIAKSKYESSRYLLLAQQQKEKTEIDTMKSQIESLTNNLSLAEKNEQLMLENISISENMFKNGTINAQLLSDSIMKYLDVFMFLYNTELQLIDLYAKKITKQQINVNEILSTL